MHLSQKASAISPSITLSIDAQAKKMQSEGVDVIGFGAGEPDFPTPPWIVQAAKEAMDRGETRYTPVAGTLELRQAICDKLLKNNGLVYEPAHIVVSNGAKHSLFNCCMAVVDDGDEVIIPSPYWVTYPELVKMAGGVPVFVRTMHEDGFLMTPQAFKAAITKRTRALILNSPSNPCGSMYSRAQLEAIAQIAVDNDIIVISDEIYECLVYDGAEFVSIASLGDEIKAHTIVVNGVSKAYAMTGWRIGYTAAPKDVTDAMSGYQSHATSNPNSIAQAASVAALKGPDTALEQMRAEFESRRNLMVEILNGIDGFNCNMPQGAFYTLPDISGCYGKKSGGVLIDGSMTFCSELLEKALVAAVPGIAFGDDNTIRLSYATSRQNIEKGLQRIKAFVQGLK